MNTLRDLFTTFAEKGDRTAFELRSYRSFRFTYRNLDQFSRVVAEILAGKGIGKGDRVVIWAPNSPWWVVAYFGVLLRGGVVVPVDFASDNLRARWIAEKAGAKFAYVSRYKAGVDLGIQAVMMEELEERLGQPVGEHANHSDCPQKKTRSVPPASELPLGSQLGSPRRAGHHARQASETLFLAGNPHLENISPQILQEGGERVKESDMAVLIYTSGTTGEPKGVPLTHANLTANLTAVRKHVEVLPSDVFLSVLPLSHMFEMMAGCLVPLSVGARVIYLRTIKPSAIFEALSSGAVTVFVSVPRLLAVLKGSIEQKFDRLRLRKVFSLLRRVMRTFAPRARKKMFWFIHEKIGPRFRYFVSGGAALDMDTARFWDDLGFTVLEGYGLTECAPVLTANQPGKVVLGSVGSPVPGVEIRIAQDGEVEARGPNIVAGYADNPQATKNAFTEDGWFKTGDVGEFREHLLTIKSRKKDVIVTAAGINVYPEDVEAVLQQIPGVNECAVVGIDRGQGECVHAVLVLAQGVEAATIIAQANRQLDALQQIQDWTLWEGELPKTTTLKVKKDEVKRIVGAYGNTPVQEGEGEKQEMVKMIIGAVVRKDPAAIRGEDRLMTDLNLTSLDRADLLSRLEQEFRLDLPEDAVGKDTTVAELIDIVKERKRFRSRHHMRVWAFSKPLQMVRSVVFVLTVRPLMRWIGRPRVYGIEHILSFMDNDVSVSPRTGQRQSAFILASNHMSYFDQPMTLSVLPWRMRGRIATAAREDFFFDTSFGMLMKLFGRLSFEFCTFFVGAFLLPQGKQVSESLAFMGKLADYGCPLFIYPEGERSWDGKLLPFQPGLARMVQELRLPVVPVIIQGMERIFPRGTWKIRRGRAEVRFGKALRFAPSTSAEEVLRAVQNAIVALSS